MSGDISGCVRNEYCWDIFIPLLILLGQIHPTSDGERLGKKTINNAGWFLIAKIKLFFNKTGFKTICFNSVSKRLTFRPTGWEPFL